MTWQSFAETNCQLRTTIHRRIDTQRSGEDRDSSMEWRSWFIRCARNVKDGRFSAVILFASSQFATTWVVSSSVHPASHPRRQCCFNQLQHLFMYTGYSVQALSNWTSVATTADKCLQYTEERVPSRSNYINPWPINHAAGALAPGAPPPPTPGRTF